MQGGGGGTIGVGGAPTPMEEQFSGTGQQPVQQPTQQTQGAGQQQTPMGRIQ